MKHMEDKYRLRLFNFCFLSNIHCLQIEKQLEQGWETDDGTVQGKRKGKPERQHIHNYMMYGTGFLDISNPANYFLAWLVST